MAPEIVEVRLDAAVTARQPSARKRSLFMVGGFCSIGGYLFGLDTGSIGPVTTMPSFLALYPELDNQSALGAIVATILISASLASLAGGWFADKFSRKRTISLGAFIFAMGAALEAGSMNLPMFIMGRLLAGVGEGLFLSAIGVYLVEIAPPEARGRSSSTLQLGITTGVASGYFLCYGSSNLSTPSPSGISSIAWRIPYIYQTAVALTLAIGLLHPTFIPNSPRWLLQQGRVEQAFAVMDSFNRGSSAEREKEEILANAAESGPQATVAESFRDPKTRWRTVFAIFLYGMQQASGIDGILYYAPLLFAQAGLASREASFLASGISGIVLVLCTIPAQYWFMDHWGRRRSTILGGLGMAACMITLGAINASGTHSAFGKWLSVAVIYAFISIFSLTWAVCLKLFITEIQPTRTRATASSLAHSSNWLVNLAIALSTPIFFARSRSAPYFVWGACLAVTSLVCLLYMPETLGKSLQEIDVVWDAKMASARSLLRSLSPFRAVIHHRARARGAPTGLASASDAAENLDLPEVGIELRALAVVQVDDAGKST